MPDLHVFRVTFSGDWLPNEEEPRLADSGVWLERSSRPGVGPSRHSVLTYAAARQEAIQAVRDALYGHGGFAGFDAESVRDATGQPWRGGFYRRWGDVAWDAVPERAELTEVQRAVMGALADAAEPTVLIVRELGQPTQTVEALHELREAGLVESETAPFFDAEYHNERADWWKLTDEAWDRLGFIKSVGYR